MTPDWRCIDGFPDYEVNPTGQVRSWKFNRWGRASEPRLLRPGTGKNGYPLVVLQGRRADGTWFQQPHYVHRLVARAFLGPCPVAHEVNHKNSDRSDPRLENLEYVTSSENNFHAVRAGRMKGGGTRGAQVGCAKLTDDTVREIRASRETLTVLASRYGISVSSLHAAKTGKTWKHVS